MRVVSNPSVVSKPKSPGRTQTTGNRSDRQVTTIKPRSRSVPTSLKSRPVPIWFLRLRFWQRRSSLITLMLIGGTLLTYSFTVYLQQQWAREFRKLESLQRHERQLTTTNEVLKNQLATQAEQPSTGLVPPNPADAIILKTSSPITGDRPSLQPPSPKIDIPSGY
ncbi:hypothetical protein [Synechocystis sp. PCC 7509]|uniref:hypothetical protein n=1 Tax=Synechocystis sp. PCC 7509 TaxID=927677 RepID=UPI0002AC7288|nr:hypothetical protein [Synechocystis sp. PCC 7509]